MIWEMIETRNILDAIRRLRNSNLYHNVGNRNQQQKRSYDICRASCRGVKNSEHVEYPDARDDSGFDES